MNEIDKLPGAEKNALEVKDEATKPKDTSNKGIPKIPNELLNGMPAESRKIIEQSLKFSMQGVHSTPRNPIFRKIDGEHIHKVLDIAKADDEREFQNTISQRRYGAFYVIIFVCLFVFVTVYVGTSDKDLYKEMLKFLLTYLGGLGSGYGLKTYLEKKD